MLASAATALCEKTTLNTLNIIANKNTIIISGVFVFIDENNEGGAVRALR